MQSIALDNEGVSAFWRLPDDTPRLIPLDRHATADVVVIGAGIAGLTSAYLLSKRGLSVTLIESDGIGAGQTGRTTAHLDTALDDRFVRLERLFGVAGSHLAASGHRSAVNLIEEIVRTEEISCDFERLDGFLFLPPGERFQLLHEELDAAERAGLDDVTLEADRTTVVEIGAALRFPRQAQLHPLRYLAGLARAALRYGTELRKARAVDVEEVPDGCVVHTELGLRLHCHAAIVATNTPFHHRLALHMKQAPYVTYVIAAPIDRGGIPRALYWDTADPYHYVRYAAGLDRDHDVLIVGGEDHKAGQANDGTRRFVALEKWARQYFPAMEEVRWRWSGLVMEPVDSLGFMGRGPAGDQRIFVVTGDSGNGMTHGTLGACIISDAVMRETNDYLRLFDPSRITRKALGAAVRQNLNVVEQYGDLVRPGEIHDVDELQPGEGAVMRRGVSLVAISRDPDGHLHQCSAICTHLGCVVHWNSTEHAWDCPCHGSRFAPNGAVLHGPAISPLERVEREDPAESVPSSRASKR